MREFGFAKKYMRRWWVSFVIMAALTLIGVAGAAFIYVPAIWSMPLFLPLIPQHRVLPFLVVLGLPGFIVVASGSSLFALWLLRRLLKSVYLVDEAGLTRVRAGNRARVDFSEVRGVRRKWLGTALETPESSMTVPKFVESCDQLMRLLKEGIEGAGGAFPQELYAASLRAAAHARWDSENEGKFLLGVTAVMVIAAVLGSAMGYLLDMGEDAPLLGALLSTLLFSGLTAAFLRWLSAPRFRDAGKPGWEPPGSAYAWKILFLSAGITLFVYLAAATAVLHIFT